MDDLRPAVAPWSARLGLVLLVLVAGAGCDRVDARPPGVRTTTIEAVSLDAAPWVAREWPERERQDSINRARPGYIVDSILPIDEALRRFRAGLSEPAPTALVGGAGSREALVRSFIRALERRDSVGLDRMALSPAEFAWLVYPTSPFVAPPYRQAPGLVWMQIGLAGASGRARLLLRLAGRPLGYSGHRCASELERQGENRIWRGCAVRLTQPGGSRRMLRLFGDIIERGGQFKFVSFANDL